MLKDLKMTLKPELLEREGSIDGTVYTDELFKALTGQGNCYYIKCGECIFNMNGPCGDCKSVDNRCGISIIKSILEMIVANYREEECQGRKDNLNGK